MRVNYVVACWGEGRTAGNVSREECLGYLNAQINVFNKYKHSLAQLTIVHPHWSTPAGFPEYEKRLLELDGSTLNNGTPIKVVRRPNIDRSYGGFSDVYGMYRNEFDYYFFVEDDYVICQDNFDRILVDILEEKKCDYLCTLVSHTTWNNNGIPHAGMTAGVVKSSALETVWQKYDALIHDCGQDIGGYYWNGQLLFSYPFHFCGLKIDDFADRYSTPFWYAQQSRIEMFRIHGDSIIVPVQYYRSHWGPI